MQQKEKNLKVISFGIKSHKANIKLINVKPFGKKFRINISLNNKKKNFSLPNYFQNNILILSLKGSSAMFLSS